MHLKKSGVGRRGGEGNILKLGNAKRIMMMNNYFSEDLFDVRLWCPATEIKRYQLGKMYVENV